MTTKTQSTPAEIIAKLQSRPGWPRVDFDPVRLLPADFEGEAVLTGDHPALAEAPGTHGVPGCLASACA